MRLLQFHRKILKCRNEDQVFDYIISTLKPSNRLWSYFVNWDKVFRNTKKIEVALNILNYLIGKVDFDREFRFLIRKHPEITVVIPALSVRNGRNSNKFTILVDYKKKKLVYEDFDFCKKTITNEDIEKYLSFVTGTGLKELLVDRRIKNLVDYMIGVEAGLDSNGRKNRGGHTMENIVEIFVKDECDKKKYKYIKEADASKIQTKFGYKLPVAKSSRRYDFVIDTKKELILIETNFYGGSGSKLKSAAGEYRNLFDVLEEKYKFIWITDGLGWKTTSRPLRETFDHNDYVFNLDMLEHGALQYLI